jgi:hypothetical protein
MNPGIFYAILFSCLALTTGFAQNSKEKSPSPSPNFLKGTAQWQTVRPTIALPGRVIRVSGEAIHHGQAEVLSVSVQVPVTHEETDDAVLAIMRKYSTDLYSLAGNSSQSENVMLKLDFRASAKDSQLVLRELCRNGLMESAIVTPKLSDSEIKKIRTELIAAASGDCLANAKEALKPFGQLPGEVLDINVLLDPDMFESSASPDKKWLNEITGTEYRKPLSGDDFDGINRFTLSCMVDGAFAYHPVSAEVAQP